nr:MAG TPA: hypothetical protein [Caudoviricetes sp.]
MVMVTVSTSAGGDFLFCAMPILLSAGPAAVLSMFKLFHHSSHLNCFHRQMNSHLSDFVKFFLRNGFICLDGVPHSGFNVEFQRYKGLLHLFQFFTDDVLALVRACKRPEALVCGVQFLVYQLSNVTFDYIHLSSSVYLSMFSSQ